MARPKKTKRPDPIVLGSGKTTFATAYANRPPTKKNPNWSWKMVYNDGHSTKPKSESIGRMSEAQVEKELRCFIHQVLLEPDLGSENNGCN